MYIIKERVGASRTDTRGIMKLTSAIDALQDCSMLWMESEPLFSAFLAENNLGMFLLSRQVNVLRLPAYRENIEIRTGIFDCKGYYGYRNTALYGQDGEPCLISWSIGAFVSHDAGRMARLPQDVVDGIKIEPKLDMEYLSKKITVAGDEKPCPATVPVRRNDIDLYHHVNNARYIEAALELIPESFAVNRLRVEYKAPAKAGDIMYPSVISGTKGELFVLFSDGAGGKYAIIEFT